MNLFKKRRKKKEEKKIRNSLSSRQLMETIQYWRAGEMSLSVLEAMVAMDIEEHHFSCCINRVQNVRPHNSLMSHTNLVKCREIKGDTECESCAWNCQGRIMLDLPLVQTRWKVEQIKLIESILQSS